MRRRRILGATLWDLTEAFFAAQRVYNRIYMNYETRVLSHAEQQAVDRHQLRLDAAEVSKLLDFASLGELRNGPLHRTKEISHSLFRSAGRTHKFDRYISEIFHDLSILREEQYKVSTFAEEYRRENEMAEYESLLDEVHEDFPRRVHNIWGLFLKAQRSLEGVLRAHSRDKVYLRSLYLFGDETLSGVYQRGKVSHCWRVFDQGPAEAWLLAARSFVAGGFKDKAVRALEDAIQAAQAPPGGECSPEALAQLEVDARALLELVADRSPAELLEVAVRVGVGQTVPATQHGDDAAPGLFEDVVTADDLED